MGGVVNAVSNIFGGGSKPAAPPTPDYRGAAEATAASNREAATANTWSNRPTINTPWGRQSWESQASIDPATGQKVTSWTQNTTLNPMSQKALDSEMAMQVGRSDLANSFMDRVRQSYANPIDYGSMQGWGKAYDGAGVNANFNTSVMNNANQMRTSGIGGSGMYQPVANSMYQQAASRLDPRFSDAQRTLDSRLAAQGISRNSNAFSRAQRDLAFQRNDAYNQAMNSAIQGGIGAANTMQGMDIAQLNTLNSALVNQQNLDLNAKAFGNQAITQQNQAQNQAFNQSQQIATYQNALRQAQIAEAQQKRSQALNDMNAVISGQQVAMPQMPSFNQATQYGGTNYMQAAQNQAQFNQDQVNAQNAQANNQQSGLFGLAGTALQGAMMFSDIRLKTDIKPIGTVMDGKVNVYEYQYVGSKQKRIGVMAQELMGKFPDMVKRHVSGYLMVDYNKLLGAI